MQSECRSDQTPESWNIEIGGVGAVSSPREIGEDGAEGAPVSEVEVVAASRESAGRGPSRGAFGTSRLSSISCILSFCASTLPLLRLVRGTFAPS